MGLGLKKKGFLYIVLSFGLWLVAEYVTVWHNALGQWISLMPWVLAQYAAIAAFFWYALFRRNLALKWVFVLMVAVMYFLEILWQNPLLFSLETFGWASVLLLLVWSVLVFGPFFVVQRLLK
jgi:hypothetical protein